MSMRCVVVNADSAKRKRFSVDIPVDLKKPLAPIY